MKGSIFILLTNLLLLNAASAQYFDVGFVFLPAGLEVTKVFHGAVILAILGGLEALVGGDSAGLFMEFLEGEVGASAWVKGFVSGVEFGALGIDSVVDGGGFDGVDAAQAPGGGDELVD